MKLTPQGIRRSSVEDQRPSGRQVGEHLVAETSECS